MPLATPQLSPDAVRLMNAMASISTKDAGTTAGTMLHGPGGLLGVPGLNKQIINAMIMPRGIAGRIPVMKSTNTNELYPIFTGQLASSGHEPTAACRQRVSCVTIGLPPGRQIWPPCVCPQR